MAVWYCVCQNHVFVQSEWLSSEYIELKWRITKVTYNPPTRTALTQYRSLSGISTMVWVKLKEGPSHTWGEAETAGTGEPEETSWWVSYPKKEWRGEKWAFFSGGPVTEPEEWAQSETHEVPFELQEIFWCESGYVLALVAQWDCKISLHPWKAIWTWPWATDSTWPDLSRVVDQMTSRGPFQSQTFCASMSTAWISIQRLKKKKKLAQTH